MSVWAQLKAKLNTQRLHFTLLDPDHHLKQNTGEMAVASYEAGTDAFMVGGSTGVTQEKLFATVEEIKAITPLPVILFPSGARAITPNLDAVFFMSVLNSRNVRFVMNEQLFGSLIIKEMGIETIPMGYVIVAPGMKVGEVSEADVVRHDDFQRAIGYALMTQYFGMKLVYLEAGSGAPVPVPAEMVRRVREQIEIPLIIGGGIRTPAAARELAEAGADIIVTGTIVEESNHTNNIKQVLTDIISAVKSVPPLPIIASGQCGVCTV